jgi:hypothetical protein
LGGTGTRAEDHKHGERQQRYREVRVLIAWLGGYKVGYRGEQSRQFFDNGHVCLLQTKSKCEFSCFALSELRVIRDAPTVKRVSNYENADARQLKRQHFMTSESECGGGVRRAGREQLSPAQDLSKHATCRLKCMKIKMNLRVRGGGVRFLELSVKRQYDFLYGAKNADAIKLRIFLIRRIILR